MSKRRATVFSLDLERQRSGRAPAAPRPSGIPNRNSPAGNSANQKRAQTVSLPDRSALHSAMQNPDARAYARTLDISDPLRAMRAKFLIPRHGEHDQLYFCGNSLGLQPAGARAHVEEVLQKWAEQAVEGHFTGQAQ